MTDKTRKKILLTILLAALATYLFGCGYAGEDKVKNAPTQNKLQARYRELNEDYFYGGLPYRKTAVVISDLSSIQDMGRIEHREDDTWVIFVDREANPVERQAELTLIHEMCHQQDE